MVRPMLASDRGTQPVLLPTDARDLLPTDHMAWQILDVVDELDLDQFYAAYRSDGLGRPPYDPAMMLALILYCATKNIRGSRRIEDACVDDLGCRIITGNTRPDHTTISRFFTDHAAALRHLLPQTLHLCDEAGLIDLSLIAGDGTKVQANAAMHANVDEDTLNQQIAALRQQIAEVEAQWQAAITEPNTTSTPSLFDLDQPTPTPTAAAAGADRRAWRRLTNLRRTLNARLQALTHLATRPTTERTEWEAKLERDQARVTRCQEALDTLRAKVQTAYEKRQQAEAAGARIPGTRPVPVDQHAHVRKAEQALATAAARAQATAASPPVTGKVNTTDPHSRVMPAKHGGFDQLYNLEATAVASQVILGIGLHDNPNDKQALSPLLAITRANLDEAGIDRSIGVALFDSGFASEDNFTAEPQLPVEMLLVSTRQEAAQTGRRPDHDATVPEAWQDMTIRLADPANHALYKRRGAIIEPVFAQLFNHFGHDLLRRGDALVETELHVWAVSHNLGKLLRHRRRASRTRPPG